MKICRRGLFFLGVLAYVSAVRLDAEVTPLRPTAAAPEVWSRTELYFGIAKSDGKTVTDAEIAGFVDAEVTPRFPEGLTLLTGYGQFRNSARVLIKEKSFVLVLFYPPRTAEAHRKIEEIRERYKYLFRQESVLRVDSFSVLSY